MAFIDLPYGRIGVFADVHDNLILLRKMLAICAERDLDTLLFAGDFCSPIAAMEMLKFRGVIHAVFGNGDGDRLKIYQLADQKPGFLMLHGEYAEFEMVGLENARRQIAMTHYPFYAQALARTGYDLTIYGHSHERKLDAYGDGLCLNPGEVMNWKEKACFAIYDPEKNAVEFVELT